MSWGTLSEMSPTRHRRAAVASLSPSRASDFMTCPLLYRFRTVDRLPEPFSPAAVRGTLVHKVLEDLFDHPSRPSGRPTEPSTCSARPGRACSTRSPSWPRCSPRRARTCRTGSPRATSSSTPTSRSRTPPASSRPSASSTSRPRPTPGSRCAATSTGLDVAPTGEIRIVDYKTGRSPHQAFESKALFQMKFYALVIWRTRGVDPDPAPAPLPRQRGGAALLADRGRPARHRTQADSAVGGHRARRRPPATGDPARASSATGAHTRRSAPPSAALPRPFPRRPRPRVERRPAMRAGPIVRLPASGICRSQGDPSEMVWFPPRVTHFVTGRSRHPLTGRMLPDRWGCLPRGIEGTHLLGGDHHGDIPAVSSPVDGGGGGCSGCDGPVRLESGAVTSVDPLTVGDEVEGAGVGGACGRDAGCSPVGSDLDGGGRRRAGWECPDPVGVAHLWLRSRDPLARRLVALLRRRCGDPSPGSVASSPGCLLLADLDTVRLCMRLP